MDIQWDSEASLMRVTRFNTADDAEELIARGTVWELTGSVLEMAGDVQDALLIRVSGPDWTAEYDGPTIRELAARPEFTAAYGADDTAALPREQRPAREAPGDPPAGPTGVHPDRTIKPDAAL